MEQAWKCKRLYVLAEGPSWFALYKPPFWVVAASGDADAEKKMLPEAGKEKLNMLVWIYEELAVHYLICKDATEQFGLMHRLDAQTSGVMLCAKSFSGAYWIMQ